MQSESQQSKSSVSTGSSANGGEPEKSSPKSKSKKSSPSDSLHVMLLASRFEVRGSSTQTLVLAEHLSDYGIRSTIVTPGRNRIAPQRRRQLDIRGISVPGCPANSARGAAVCEAGFFRPCS